MFKYNLYIIHGVGTFEQMQNRENSTKQRAKLSGPPGGQDSNHVVDLVARFGHHH